MSRQQAATVAGNAQRPTVLLDRDGVINRNRGDYVKSWEEFEFLPGSLKALRLLSEQQARVIVVTNQSAVGRGIISAAELAQIHERMQREVAAYGGHIDAVLCCTHAPDAGCRCRKPRPGLILQAMDRFGIDPGACCYVGDSLSDLLAARAAGIPFVMVLTGRGTRTLLRSAGREYPLSWVARDLYTAVRWFLRRDGWREERAA